MSFYGNNNKYNNNNGGRFHNRYVVPVSLGTTAAPGTHVPGNSRQSARNAAAEAAQHEQDWQMAARVHHQEIGLEKVRLDKVLKYRKYP